MSESKAKQLRNEATEVLKEEQKKTLSDFSVTELKAMVYDRMGQVQAINNEIAAINSEIQKRS